MIGGCNVNIKGVGNINIHEHSDVKNYHRAISLSGTFDDILSCIQITFGILYIRTTLF